MDMATDVDSCCEALPEALRAKLASVTPATCADFAELVKTALEIISKQVGGPRLMEYFTLFGAIAQNSHKLWDFRFYLFITFPSNQWTNCSVSNGTVECSHPPPHATGLCLFFVPTLVCCQPTELIWAFVLFFLHFTSLHLPPPAAHQCRKRRECVMVRWARPISAPLSARVAVRLSRFMLVGDKLLILSKRLDIYDPYFN